LFQYLDHEVFNWIRQVIVTLYEINFIDKHDLSSLHHSLLRYQPRIWGWGDMGWNWMASYAKNTHIWSSNVWWLCWAWRRWHPSLLSFICVISHRHAVDVSNYVHFISFASLSICSENLAEVFFYFVYSQLCYL
jgi:hypothetical protein